MWIGWLEFDLLLGDVHVDAVGPHGAMTDLVRRGLAHAPALY